MLPAENDQEFLERTRAVFQEYSKEPLTLSDAREIVINLRQFISALLSERRACAKRPVLAAGWLRASI